MGVFRAAIELQRNSRLEVSVGFCLWHFASRYDSTLARSDSPIKSLCVGTCQVAVFVEHRVFDHGAIIQRPEYFVECATHRSALVLTPSDLLQC